MLNLQPGPASLIVMDDPEFGATKNDADLVVGAKGGNQRAFNQLFDRWFNKVWNTANSIVNDDDTATRLTQATFLEAWRQLHRLETPSTFGGWVLLTSRQKALDALEDNTARTKSRDISKRDPIVSDGISLSHSVDSVDGQQLVSDQISQQHLLWAVTETLGEKEASLIDLRLRYGLSTAELANELEISNKEVQRRIGEQRNQLVEAIRNFYLWNQGEPRCSKLGALIEGSETYKPSVVRTVKGHHISCGDCKTRRLRLQSPEQLFSSIPLFDVPSKVKDKVIAKLAKDGLVISAKSSAFHGNRQAAADIPPQTTAPAFSSQPDSAPETKKPEIDEVLSDRFPTEVDSTITERFDVIKVDESSTFAQDSPVRYSRRPPRVAPVEKSSRFNPSKAILVSAASLLFIVAVIAVVFTGRDPSGVSATGVANTASTSSSTTSTTAALILPDVAVAEEPEAEVTTSAPVRRTTVAPTTTTPPATTTTTSTTLAPTTTTAPVRVLIPQLANVPAALAVPTLNNLGLETEVREFETGNPRLVGLVRNTNPRAGQSVELGSTVVVRVYVAA